MSAIEMAPDPHGEPGAGAAAALLGDLQDDPLQRDGVIGGDDARFFVAEDGLELGRGDRDEGGGGIRGGPARPRSPFCC